MCAVCWTVCFVFEVAGLCCLWECLWWVWGSEFLLCVVKLSVVFWGSDFSVLCGTVWSGFGGVSLCCVWESLERARVSVCVLLLGEFCVCLGE